MDFDKILIDINRIGFSVAKKYVMLEDSMYDLERIYQKKTKKNIKIKSFPNELDILEIEENDLIEFLKQLFMKDILILELDCEDLNLIGKIKNKNNMDEIGQQIFKILENQINSKKNMHINLKNFNECFIESLAIKIEDDIKMLNNETKKINKLEKDSNYLKEKTKEIGDNIQSFSRDIMVIMSLFIAIIGFVTTNNNVYNIISHYDIKRQILTVLSANLAVAYVITTVFVLIDSIVSFSSDKSKVRTIWIWMTIFMGFIILFLK